MDDLGLIEFLPNVEELFKIYNEKYFGNYLIDVKLEWSEKMTRCAGICMLKPGREVIIRLSRPLLQYRPFSDTIDTLIHEMIHAYFFVRQGGSIDRDGHGPDFCAFMEKINKVEGTHITIYHSFHDEVNHFKKHIWRCNGPCRLRPPFYGWVKRSMNRKPQPADSWWKAHQATCNGTFVKVSEPETTKKESKKAADEDQTGKQSLQTFKGKGRTWSESFESESTPKKITEFFKKPTTSSDSKEVMEVEVKSKVITCVNCKKYKTESLKELNEHLDICLNKIIDLT